MNRGEIRVAIRNQLDDTSNDPFWSNNELNLYIQEAFDEIAKRTLCIKDSRTAKFCHIPLVADTIHYAYPDGVLEVESIRKSWDGRELCRTTQKELSATMPLWEIYASQPIKYLTDYSLDIISIVGNLDAISLSSPEKLYCTVRRMPDVMVDDASIPDIPSRFHMKCLNWVLYRCFSKQDAQVYNPSKANFHLTAFEGQRGLLGKGGDIEQIIIQTNQFQPHNSTVRFF